MDYFAEPPAEAISDPDRCRAADRELAAEHRTLLVREPFEVDPRATIVEALVAAAAGIPTAIFGPGGEGAHEVEEWVSVSDTETVARTLTGVARRLCA